jgi:arylsulfatase A-like enzyme
MPHFAGCEAPDYMDSQPLPDLGLTDHPPRDRIFGMLTDGWMAVDGQWKLAKYASGETVLFNLRDDPHEQRDLAGDTAYADVYRRLDAELTQELMKSLRFAMHDRLAQSGDMSQDQGFGREGWQRPFPAPVDFA